MHGRYFKRIPEIDIIVEYDLEILENVRRMKTPSFFFFFTHIIQQVIKIKHTDKTTLRR